MNYRFQTLPQGDCIYFDMCSEPGVREFYSYNVQKQSLMNLRPCPNLVSPVSSLVWLVPPYLRTRSSSKIDFQSQGASPINNQGLELSVTQESMLNKLPLHMVEFISNYMHLFEYWNFRATCRTLGSLSPAPQCRTNNAFPLFMFLTNNSESCELFDPCRDDSRSRILQLSPELFTLQFSKNGWLLLLVGEKSLQYFNLYTGVRGEFPRFKEEDSVEFRSIAFSTCPTCPECLTVGIVNTGDDNQLILYYLESRKRTWIRYCYDNTYFPAGTSCPVFLRGAFYYLDMRGYLGEFRLIDGNPSWRNYGKPQTLQKFFSCNLIECTGELYAVFIENTGKLVQVFRFDHVIESWVEITCLENHIFFISRASSVSVSIKDPKLRNRIYLPRFRGKNKMVFYSLDTRKFHVSRSEDYMGDLFYTYEPFKCCWI